jgi:hypothetical protein
MKIEKLDIWAVKDVDTSELIEYTSLDEASKVAAHVRQTRYVDKWFFIDVKKKIYVDDSRTFFNLEKISDISSCQEDDHFMVINSVIGGLVYEPKSLTELEEMANKFLAETIEFEDFDVVYRKRRIFVDSDQAPIEEWIIDS